jgi:hypothetical protein
MSDQAMKVHLLKSAIFGNRPDVAKPQMAIAKLPCHFPKKGVVVATPATVIAKVMFVHFDLWPKGAADQAMACQITPAATAPSIANPR